MSEPIILYDFHGSPRIQGEIRDREPIAEQKLPLQRVLDMIDALVELACEPRRFILAYHAAKSLAAISPENSG